MKTAVSIYIGCEVFKYQETMHSYHRTVLPSSSKKRMTKVDVISIENVKPSSPTPPHLRTFNLSLLNQLIPAPYAPVILYYPNQDGATKLQVHERQHQLKRSLSETLTHLYPLAGTIKDDLSVDCDDAGASYAVACVDTSLTDFLKHLDLESINCLLPCDPTFNCSTSGVRVTNVQVNIFECGGLAISLCISHKILDGAALATFLKSWAALQQTIRLSLLNSTRSEEIVYPDLTIPFLPAKDTRLRDSSMLMWASLIKIGKCCTTRFAFDRSAIATLKAEAAKNGVQQPTRVEVVSALLWKCVMAASHEKCGFKKPSLLSHVVNLRKRAGTTLSENSIGNLVWLASTECTCTTDIRFHELVEQVRGSILKIGSEFVVKLQGEKGEEAMEESLRQMKDCGRDENVDYIGFTSWLGMGFYEVDFGWGKPIWVCGSVSHGSPVFTDFVVLMDTRYDNEGVEAWVNMDEDKMRILQHNPELLAYASLDPSPLQICEASTY